jgi:membrane protease subunit HflC
MKENAVKTKKSVILWGVILGVYILGSIIFFMCFNVNQVYRSTLVRQFGETVRIVDEPGVYFTNPFQDEISIYTGERVYDVPVTNVTTSDKKTMEADAYVTWKITDAQTYYRQLSSVEAATGRLSSNVYSSMKKVISSTTQEDVIAGKDGTLATSILNSITNLNTYGITITSFDIKGLDLPDENKESVYERMISERDAIAAKEKAAGEKILAEAKAATDKTVRETKSNAELEAANISADAERQYYETLRLAYSSTPEKEEFYRYWLGLETLKESLKNGATIQITEDDPLYQILVNANKAN